MDWASLFIHDTTWRFVAEILIRCVLMYCMILLFLRLTGKRGVRQLSIFEVAIILCLGSIAGDPMFTPNSSAHRHEYDHLTLSFNHAIDDEI